MRRLDAAGIPYAGPAALSFFEQALARNDAPIGALGGAGSPALPDHGGVRVLDAMQARGLSFDSVFLIGFNADLFPPRRTEDPFLPDADRRALRAALQARSPRLLLDALPRGVLPFAPESLDALRPGLAMLAVVEEFTPADLRFDAFVGAAAPPASRFSPSRLEILGACPQHYFFRHVLLIEEMDEVRETYELEAREIGSKVHAVLRDVFAGLIRSDGSLPDGPADETARRAAGLARAAWTRHTRDIAGRTTARYPL